ncbi:hypothetical protein ACFLZX_03100 [Nanoarchaeota archaeon]
MKRRLLDVNNILPIEDLLATESLKLDKLQRQKEGGDLTSEKVVSRTELQDLAPEVCHTVEDLLGVEVTNRPPIRYFSLIRPGLPELTIIYSYSLSISHAKKSLEPLLTGQISVENIFYATMSLAPFALVAFTHYILKDSNYQTFWERINIKKGPRTKVIPSVAHEYTHHIQNKDDAIPRKSTIFREGQARQIEAKVAEIYCERECNEAFLYDVQDLRVGELKSTYLWLCQKFGKVPKQSLLSIKTSMDTEKDQSPHSLGNTLFLLYPTLTGKEFYVPVTHQILQPS